MMDVLRLAFWQLRLLFLSYRCCFLAMAMIPRGTLGMLLAS